MWLHVHTGRAITPGLGSAFENVARHQLKQCLTTIGLKYLIFAFPIKTVGRNLWLFLERSHVVTHWGTEMLENSQVGKMTRNECGRSPRIQSCGWSPVHWVGYAVWCFVPDLWPLMHGISGLSSLPMKQEAGAFTHPLPVFANNYHPVHNGLCNAPTSFN
jgi:hypothetical protein